MVELLTNLKAKDKRLKSTYGISLEEYQAQAKRQNYKCYICQKIKPLVVDHIHVKDYKKLPLEEKRKYVRLLLCTYCNKWIVGLIDRSLEGRKLLEKLCEYFSSYMMKSDL